MTVPELGGLKVLQASYHRQQFSRHVHEGYCIGVIESGAQKFYRDGAYHRAPANSMIFVNADQVHDGQTATPEGWSYQAIYPTPELIMPACEEFALPMGLPYFPEPVIEDPYGATQLRRLIHLAAHDSSRLEKDTHFMSLMVYLAGRHGRNYQQLPTLGKESRSIQQIRDYLDEHLDHNIALNTLAELVGLTPHYLTRLFHKNVGLPPHAYHLQGRLLKAQQLLCSGESCTDAALSTGFTDQSHLSRHFKRCMGITPGQYQQGIA